LIEVNISDSNSVSGVLVDPSLKFWPILNSEILVTLWVEDDGNRHFHTWPTQDLARKDTDNIGIVLWALEFGVVNEPEIRGED